MNFNIFGRFQENEFFGGYDEIVHFFFFFFFFLGGGGGGVTTNLHILRVFLKVKVQNGNIFWG